jgi:dolichol kinase
MNPRHERGHWLRRGLHIAYGGVVLFYLFPPVCFGIPTLLYLAVFFVGIPIIIEAIRLTRGAIFIGLREHERHHVASYLWFTAGAVLLIAIFPQQIAAPCILSAAIGDPIIGETRRFRRRFAFSIGFLVCFAIFLLFHYPIGLAIIAGGITFIAESIELEIQWGLREDLFTSRSKGRVSKYRQWFDFVFKADDDFMMQVVPAIIITILAVIGMYYSLQWLCLPEEPLITPLEELEAIVTG